MCIISKLEGRLTVKYINVYYNVLKDTLYLFYWLNEHESLLLSEGSLLFFSSVFNSAVAALARVFSDLGLTACLSTHIWFVPSLLFPSWNSLLVFLFSLYLFQVRPGLLRTECQSEMSFPKLLCNSLCVPVQWNIFIWKDLRWFRRICKITRL